MTTYKPQIHKDDRSTIASMLPAPYGFQMLQDLARCEACLRETQKELYQRNAQLEKAEKEIERLKAKTVIEWVPVVGEKVLVEATVNLVINDQHVSLYPRGDKPNYAWHVPISKLHQMP